MPYNIFRCFCKTFDTCSNTSLKPRYVAFLPHILMLVKNEIFRFLPKSNFLTTEFFNEEFLARSSFLVKNFLQNQSSTSQLYIALSAINKYEILFWTDSSEKCKKMAKSAKSTSTDYLPNLERKNRKSEFFETNITTIAKCFEFWNKTPEPGLFPYLYFHDRLRTFENLDFFILKSLFLDLKMPQLFEDTFFSTRWVPNEEFFWKIKIFKS